MWWLYCSPTSEGGLCGRGRNGVRCRVRPPRPARRLPRARLTVRLRTGCNCCLCRRSCYHRPCLVVLCLLLSPPPPPWFPFPSTQDHGPATGTTLPAHRSLLPPFLAPALPPDAPPPPPPACVCGGGGCRRWLPPAATAASASVTLALAPTTTATATASATVTTMSIAAGPPPQVAPATSARRLAGPSTGAPTVVAPRSRQTCCRRLGWPSRPRCTSPASRTRQLSAGGGVVAPALRPLPA